MCNPLGQPICRTHEHKPEQAYRSAVHAVRTAQHTLTTTTTALANDDGTDPIRANTLRTGRDAAARALSAAVEQVRRAQSVWDTTLAGIDALETALAQTRPGTPEHAALSARLTIGRRTRATQEERWLNSVEWADKALSRASHTNRPKAIALLAERRAHSNGHTYPPPAGTAREVWSTTMPGRTWDALHEAGLPFPDLTYTYPDVIDAMTTPPAHRGWSPLAAAHYTHLPTYLTGPENPTVMMHRAAHTGRSWKVSASSFEAAVRAHGELFVDDNGVIATDVAAGERWRLLPIAGPVVLLHPTGHQHHLPVEGWAAARVNTPRLTTLAEHPSDTESRRHAAS